MAPRTFIWVVVATLALAPANLLAKGNDLRFKFSTDPEKVEDGVPNSQPNGFSIRPNTAEAHYLYMYNLSDDVRDVVVQATTIDGKRVLAEAKLKLPHTPQGQTAKAFRINFVKPAPPMPMGIPMPMAPAPAVAAPPMNPAAPPPPPPGIELKLTANKENSKRDFVFRIRAFDDRDKESPSEDFPLVVTIQQPTDYVQPDAISYLKKDRQNLLTATFKSNSNFSGSAPCPVELSFPPQSALKADALREGVYRRELTGIDQTAHLYAKNLPLRGQGAENGIFYVNIDRVPRAYVYQHSFFTETDGVNAKVDQLTTPAIRFMEENQLAPPPELVTRPRVVPLRVEADSNLPDARFQVRILQLPGSDLVEAIGRDTTRERRIWLDAGANEGGLLVTAQVGDWILPLNLRDLRGHYILQAALFGNNKPEPIASFDRPLIVDDTKPEEIRVDILPGRDPKENPPKHLRNKPLPVHVFAADPESKIVKVIAFFGKPGPDGKLPDGEKIEAAPPKLEGGAWVAQLPLPADKKGDQDVTVVATNAVGLSDSATMRIQLIDPPTGGTIKGTVAMSKFGKGLPGVAVVLRDNADGKEKGAATTNDKGEFIMEDVVPGSYRVQAARPDSGVGTKGEEHVRVQAGKISEVHIILSRRP